MNSFTIKEIMDNSLFAREYEKFFAIKDIMRKQRLLGETAWTKARLNEKSLSDLCHIELSLDQQIRRKLK